MKKFIIAALAVLAFATVASAQPRTIGIRATYGAELSYQHNMTPSSFIEADLGWIGGAGFGIGASYDFIFAQTGNFNFYAGPGASLGLYNYTQDEVQKLGIGLGIAGQVGAEYNFNIPLTLSIDWRPAFNIIGNTGFNWQSLALGIRYRF